ncbi:divisome protein SepX/GlpR [Corynebacterium gerontici]|uniref:Uncharacterized protein n=1 Tax=Corynebacterium gerontici TaxID=2079234 RepID=A0A3G6IZA2_9CORY|nr:gephyrin-like molybdotransferase receptor GlpR [Corynebacterium gerontici]AZA11032.1 hypothetical protein CGERO_03565 [Corynebacterium gerontici]
MSGTIAIILIASVWLFVLAPWLLRGHRPISKAGDAFEETRVVYQGGQDDLPRSRRPRLSKDDIHLSNEPDNSEVLVAEDVDEVLEDTPGATLGDLLRDAKEKLKMKRSETSDATVIEGEVVHELPAAEEPEEEPAPEPEHLPVEEEDLSEYSYSEAYEGPGDLLHPAAAEEAPIHVASEDELEDEPEELDKSDLEFAARRVGRGGWDPEAARAHREQLQRRRKQWVGGFGAAFLLSLLAAMILGGWLWFLFGLATVLLVVYLVALRRQVLAEEALRRRRIRQLRRARLGVRHAEDAEYGVPDRLRRPGAVVLEIDDDSPDFAYLDSAAAQHLDEFDEYQERRAG